MFGLEETFAKQKVEIVADELDFAVRMEREKIGATLDRLIKIDGELEVDGEVFTGEGVLEIKTDYYHQNKPKIEWIYQVNQQLICVNKTLDKKLTWGLIVCACQKGKLHTYPVKLNKKYLKWYSLKDLVNLFSQKNNLSKKKVYNICLSIKQLKYKDYYGGVAQLVRARDS